VLEGVEILAHLLLKSKRTDEPLVVDFLVAHARQGVEVFVIERGAGVADPRLDEVCIDVGIVVQDDSSDMIE
jgi:hypothetical protein